MKHLTCLSQSPVTKAEQWEEIVCTVAQTFNTILGFFGGSSPLMQFIGDKCEVKPPSTT